MLIIAVINLIYIIDNVIASGGGGSHVGSPSYQLIKNTDHYKPKGFNLKHRQLSLTAYLISFEYKTRDFYDRYIFRIRYFGFDDYATEPRLLNRTSSNTLTLRQFIPASYIICVTIYSSIRSLEYPPLSTTGMCIDLVVGDSPPVIGQAHASSGLLSPLLFAVAAVLLLFIIIIDYSEKWKIIKKLKHTASNLFKPKHEAHVDKHRRVANGSLPVLQLRKKQRSTQDENIYDNASYVPDEQLDDMSLNLDELLLKRDSIVSCSQTLKHILDDKPWFKYVKIEKKVSPAVISVQVKSKNDTVLF
jgi:hypothetical protein